MSFLLDYVNIEPEVLEPELPEYFEDILIECPLLHELHGDSGNKKAGFQEHIFLKPASGKICINLWDTQWEYQIGLDTAPEELLSDDLEVLLSFYSEGFIRDKDAFYDVGIEVIRFKDHFIFAELTSSNWRVTFSLISEKSARHISENFVNMFVEERLSRALAISGISDQDRYQACMNYLNRTNFKPFRDAEAIESIVADTPSLKGRNRVSL